MTTDHLQTETGGSELKRTAQLALPLTLAFAGTQLLSVVDVLVAGHLGERAMAAVGLGTSTFFLVAIFPIGVMLGVDPLVSQALGRGDRAITHQHAASALRLARWLTLPAMALIYVVLAIALTIADFDPSTHDAAWAYILARSLAALPLFGFIALRSLLQAWGRLAPITGSMVIGNLVNLPASFLLALGDDALEIVGLPAIGLGSGLGTLGIGLATTLVCAVQFGWLLRAARRLPDRPEADRHLAPPVGALWRLGWPVGLNLAAETSAFGATAIMMGSFGETASAGHQIAGNLTNLTFTGFIALGSATSVRVGLAVGAGDIGRARRAALAGLGLGLVHVAGTVSLFVFAGGWLAGLFTDVERVTTLATELLLIGALFQLVDGTQGIAGGGLRGAGDTRFTMRSGVAGYWLFAIPSGLLFAFGADLGPHGLWYGLVVGLSLASIANIARLMWITRPPR